MSLVRRLPTFVLAAMLALGVASVADAAPGPPVNDNFADAIVISSLPFSLAENTTHATAEGGEPTNSCNTVGQTVWFSFTPAVDMELNANTFGSRASGGDYDTLIAVFTHDPSFVEVDCNDDWHGDPRPHLSDLTFDVQGGTTYYFQIGSFGAFQYNHSRLRFNLDGTVTPTLEAVVGSPTGTNACSVHTSGTGLLPGSTVTYNYGGGPNPLGNVSSDGTFDDTGSFVEQTYVFAGTTLFNDPISTGNVVVDCHP